jgi:hypothetical protein
VDEFLDHNEFGLAFETLARALVASGEAVPGAVLRALRSAADEMGCSDDPDLNRFTCNG